MVHLGLWRAANAARLLEQSAALHEDFAVGARVGAFALLVWQLAMLRTRRAHLCGMTPPAIGRAPPVTFLPEGPVMCYAALLAGVRQQAD